MIWTPTSLVANPFVAGTWYGGVNTTSCTDPLCDGKAQAPFVLQRRPRDTPPYYVWSFKPWPVFDGTDGDLEMPWGTSMQWGVSEASGYSVDRIYHGAMIGGMWEGQLTW